MENAESSNIIPLLTVFISGIFGLIVAIVTWKLANHRENRRFKYEQKISDFKEKKELYVTLLASLDKIIRITEIGENYPNLHENMSLISAQIRIFGSENINNKLFEISETLFEWSSEYKQGLPKKLGETNFRMVSTMDTGHMEKAKIIYPTLRKQINELAKVIEDELHQTKKDLIK
ncbi:hypothetical protein [Sunxiuqinia elliptica]|uniref:Uncharacterized protein n=1 Tax=Sunxiuqinia elliptica TaxID=655355 RepID=A0A4V3BWS7_9BACT|nr:hypothetical protein [Sunxiuqinia elliptica]TDN96178.1 hypothetical protein DET52_1122 [Sunxiuqinia elliptica]TDO67889.1 hypothetical protein DET65_0002 [Sunxiuqinia elliptica]